MRIFLLIIWGIIGVVHSDFFLPGVAPQQYKDLDKVSSEK